MAALGALSLSACERAVESDPTRPMGTAETRQFTEACEMGRRCECANYELTETMVVPAIVEASSSQFQPCPRTGGMSGIPLTKARDHCKVCPDGMLYTQMVRNRSEVRQRWGVSEDVCVKTTRRCP